MSLPLAVRAEARVEFDAAFDWYEQRSPGLGVRFAEAVQERRDELAANPKRYPLGYRDVREAQVDGFPYCLYYAIESNRVLIVSIFHTSRNPNIWKRRRNTP